MSRRPEADRVVSTISTSFGGDQAGSRTRMAVVSPCSVCKNFTASTNGKSLCPRRFWANQAADAAATGNSEVPQTHLTDSGTDDPQSLVNPVYSDDSGTIAVWSASLENNPTILDPGFDTTLIHCDLYPVVPQESQAQLFSFGVWHEYDQLLVTQIKSYQQSSSVTVNIGGVARKVNFAHSFTLETPNLDSLTSGT